MDATFRKAMMFPCGRRRTGVKIRQDVPWTRWNPPIFGSALLAVLIFAGGGPTLTAQNCTGDTVPASETWFGQFAGPSTGNPGHPAAGLPCHRPDRDRGHLPPDGRFLASVTQLSRATGLQLRLDTYMKFRAGLALRTCQDAAVAASAVDQ